LQQKSAEIDFSTLNLASVAGFGRVHAKKYAKL
jgi:hypothetical protein